MTGEVTNGHLLKRKHCAIVVTYNPKGELLDNIAAIRSQTGQVVIVDNGSRIEGVSLVEEARSKSDCEAILNGSNLGIAKALNIGIEYAASRGYEKVLFFDQDSSVLDANYVTSMLSAYEEFGRSRKVAIVCPRYRDRLSSADLRMAKDRHGNLLTAMTSGSLVPISIFAELGPHDEKLYMDYVDVELSLRCRRAGYSIVEAPAAILLHSLGSRTEHTVLGHTFSTTNHDANRRYYITRNRVLLMREYWDDGEWFVREMRAMVLEFFKIVLVETNKLEKIKNVVLGIADACRNRTGERVGGER